MQFIKTKEVQSPMRSHPTDAGCDFFIPTNLNVQEMLNKNPKMKVQDFNLSANGKGTIYGIILKPQKRVLIPSGIHIKLPENHALIAFNKSGVASKTGIIAGAAVVDQFYEGEVHISLINTSSETTVIKAGAKVIQFILLPVNYSMPELINKSPKEFYEDSDSERGEGGFGSTNIPTPIPKFNEDGNMVIKTTEEDIVIPKANKDSKPIIKDEPKEKPIDKKVKKAGRPKKK